MAVSEGQLDRRPGLVGRGIEPDQYGTLAGGPIQLADVLGPDRLAVGDDRGAERGAGNGDCRLEGQRLGVEAGDAAVNGVESMRPGAQTEPSATWSLETAGTSTWWTTAPVAESTSTS